MKLKRIVPTVMLAFLAIANCPKVSAASVTFSNFSYTSRANMEAWQPIVAKTKADNEQNWYATITGSTGLSSTVDRAMLTSSTSANSMEPRAGLVPLYTYTTRIIDSYFLYTGKGSNCKLYILGDQNNKVSYKVTVSGRYTS